MKVLVTGGAGRIGKATIEELQAQGYEVTSADISNQATKIVDFEDMGQVVGIMAGHDAVIHMAAIPSPMRHTAEVVFKNNVMSTFHVLEAATILGIKHVVLASSISALGYAFPHRPFNPVYLPIDEDHPLLAQDNYGISKIVGEELAEGFVRRTPDMSIVSLRFTTVFDDRLRQWLTRLREQKDNNDILNGAFWTYVDVRDAATACRLGMEYDTPSHEAFNIAGPRITLDAPIEDLFAKHFPGDYPIADHIKGDTSPVDCSKAEKLLGWTAKYHWDGTELS